MSRLGKKPIPVPAGVTVTVTPGQVAVKGPKGELKMMVPPTVNLVVSDEGVTVTVKDDTIKVQRALWGTFAAHMYNMVEGVTSGFSKQLEINGVGMRAEIAGTKLTLHLGFSHPVPMVVPAGLQVTIEKNIITIAGIDKHLVGQFAAEIRDHKKPEPYKGKGIKYTTEHIRRKAGKTAK